MSTRRSVLCIFMMITIAAVLHAAASGIFSMRGSVLLFADRGYGLQVVTPSGSQDMQLPVKIPVNYGDFKFPSLAPDGERVAWGFAVARNPSGQASPRFVLGIRSPAQQEWKTFGHFQEIGATAFSPDGSRVAFVSEQEDRKSALAILDLSTGAIATLSHPSAVAMSASLSWSPTGTQMAVEVQHGNQPSDIAIVDVKTENVKVIGKGVDPVWSPTGEWIAYSDEAREKCNLVRPDGTETKTVRNLGRIFGYRMFASGVVWSPDGKQLLLNEMKGEGPKIDVMLLDLASGEVKRKSRNGLPVFGWVRVKH